MPKTSALATGPTASDRRRALVELLATTLLSRLLAPVPPPFAAPAPRRPPSAFASKAPIAEPT